MINNINKNNLIVLELVFHDDKSELFNETIIFKEKRVKGLVFILNYIE